MHEPSQISNATFAYYIWTSQKLLKHHKNMLQHLKKSIETSKKTQLLQHLKKKVEVCSMASNLRMGMEK
jgi:hypothetical protein